MQIKKYLMGIEEPDNKVLKSLLGKEEEKTTIKPNRAQRRAAKKRKG